jgi:hypothetical protein
MFPHHIDWKRVLPAPRSSTSNIEERAAPGIVALYVVSPAAFADRFHAQYNSQRSQGHPPGDGPRGRAGLR